MKKQHRTSYAKSKGLPNQQEIYRFFILQSSSETNTRSPLPFNFDNVSPLLPQHIKRYDQSFLEWFVGFAEGDGCFGINFTNHRISFLINQKDPRVLRFIRTRLGFGSVRSYGGYFRYSVTKREQLLLLAAIFSGNLALEKTRARFLVWLEHYASYYGVPLPPGVASISGRTPQLSLQDG